MRIIAAIGVGLLVSTSAWAASNAPVATPPGITLQSVRIGQAPEAGGVGAMRQIQRNVYADAKGMTLYTYEKDEGGKSACVGECAKTWIPLAAPANAQAPGQWSVITRDDGGKQWAHGGKPLYTYVKDAKLGDGTGNAADGGLWRIAAFDPSEGMPMPAGIEVHELLNAGGHVFVSKATGTPLYTFDEDPASGQPVCAGEECLEAWHPVVAGQLAKPVGEFTVIRRADGIYQWARNGKPLYTFSGDVVAGDAKGDNAGGGKWHVAMLVRQFMPEGVIVWHNRFGGDHLATKDGLALYERDRVSGTSTGHNQRTGQRGNPTVGRMLGVSSCDAECTKTWKPLTASADAVSTGYWDVVSRPEGAKQWAYRGFPVYTFVGDSKPGDMNGNSTYDLLREGDPFKAADVGIKGAGAMVWHTIAP